nr:AMP-binding protein [Candidatus Dadabacteria bacterium]
MAEDGYNQKSYSDLYKAVLNSASILTDLGLKRGDHISIYGENSPGLAISMLSVHVLGGVIVPLDAQLDAENA